MGTKMFKAGSFEQELAETMQEKLVSNQVENKYSFDRIAKAVDFLHAAADIFDDTGLHLEAEIITQVLEKIASKGQKVKTAAGLGDLSHEEMIFFQKLPTETQKVLHQSLRPAGGGGVDVEQFVQDVKTLYKLWNKEEDEEPDTVRNPEQIFEFDSLLHGKKPSDKNDDVIEFTSIAKKKL